MSIIADALKRLQTQSEEPPPTSKPDMSSRPVFNKGEGSGRHRKDSPFRFLIVMVGMTITLGGLAFAAFWIGGHLDFGLATNTLARINEHRLIPDGPDLLEDPVFVHPSPETRVTAVPEAIISPSSLAPTNDGQPQTSTNLNTGSATISPSPPDEVPTPSQAEVETTDPSPTNAMASTASQEQQGRSRTIDQPAREKEKSLIPPLSVSEEPTSTMRAMTLPTATTEFPDTDRSVVDQTDETEAPDLIAMSLEEEIIETEDFVNISRPGPDSAHKPITLAALEARRESTNPGIQTATPVQPTQANRLHHAQQLIRSGEYEGAVALLSPLFHDPPVKWEPWFWMGTALLGKGDMEQADQFFLSGLARNDKIPQLWIQRALVAQQRGDFQLAIHELRQAESLEADLPHIHLNMGYAYERLGNDRLANQYYGKFLELSEDQPAFFSTRKKLFARVTQQTSTEPPSSLSSPEP